MQGIAPNKLKYQPPSDNILPANGTEAGRGTTYRDVPDLRQNHQRQDKAGHEEFAGKESAATSGWWRKQETDASCKILQ